MYQIHRRGAGAFLAPIGLLLLLAAPASGQQGAGSIKSVSGAGFIVRGGQEIDATIGQVIYEADTLRTAADGRLGITLKDGTRLSLGGGTEVELQAFAYAPAENRLALAIRVLRGVAAYVSGRIADLAPSSVKIETPTSVIAVRGTHLLVGVAQR
jgi:hypothetical protein